MLLMTDLEVGRVWALNREHDKPEGSSALRIEKLIRKIVHERAGGGDNKAALVAFGIDEALFNAPTPEDLREFGSEDRGLVKDKTIDPRSTDARSAARLKEEAEHKAAAEKEKGGDKAKASAHGTSASKKEESHASKK